MRIDAAGFVFGAYLQDGLLFEQRLVRFRGWHGCELIVSDGSQLSSGLNLTS